MSQFLKSLVGLAIALFSIIVDPSPACASEFREVGYQVRRWGLDDGLPVEQVNCVLQTSNGYIWAGLKTGLARFDGIRFKVYRHGDAKDIPPTGITQLFEDASGHLLIVLNGNPVPLVRFNGQTFSTLGPEVVTRNWVDELALSTDGTLWKLETQNGVLSRLDGDRFVEVMRVDLTDLGTIGGFGVDGKHAWVTSRGRLFRLTSNAPDLIPEFGARAGQGRTKTHLFRGSDGSLLFLANDAVYQINGTNYVHQFDIPDTFQDLSFITSWVVMDTLGNLWASWDVNDRFLTGLFDRRTIVRDAVGRGGFFKGITTSTDGSVWIASLEGLFQLFPVPFQTPTVLENLPNRRITNMSPDAAGNVWMVGDKYLNRFSPKTSELMNVQPLTTQSRGHMVDVSVARNGSIWVAEWGSKVMRLSPDGQEVLETLPVPTPAGVGIREVFESSDGTLWVTTGAGLWYKRGSGLTQDKLPLELKKSQMCASGEDDQGRLFVSRKGEVFVLEQSQWRKEPLPETLRDHSPMGLKFDSEGYGWLLAFKSEASRWHVALALRGKDGWTTLDIDAADLNSPAYGLLLDQSDGVWVSTSFQGFFRFSQANLLDIAEGVGCRLLYSNFTSADGLPSTAGSEYLSKGLCMTRDGRVWVPTSGGPTSVDPHRLKRIQSLRTKPLCRIESVLVDDTIQPFLSEGAGNASNGIQPLVVPPESHRVEIQYTGINLSTPSKVQFRYRLTGYDRDWVQAKERRAAYYQGLPPGEYQFEVTASLDTNAWGGPTAALMLHVLPSWWQTWWVRLGAAGFLLGITGFAYATRSRHFQRQQAIQRDFSRRLIDTQERERKRLARELHDGLGHSLLVIKSGVIMALRKFEGSSRLRTKLEELATTADDAVKEARRVSQALRPIVLDELGLTKAITAVLRTVDDSSSFSIDSQVELVDDVLPSHIQIHVFRVIQECLSNISKHAEANRVKVLITVDEGQTLRILIEDDGRGFEVETALSAAPTQGSMVLRDIQERVWNIGGQVDIQSKPGQGSRFQITVPKGST